MLPPGSHQDQKIFLLRRWRWLFGI